MKHGLKYSAILFLSILLLGCPIHLATLNVVYNKNGASSGSVPVDSADYETGDVAFIKGNTGRLSRSDKVFTGWRTSVSGNGILYNAGDTITIGNSNLTLYAQWGQGEETGIEVTEPTISDPASIGLTLRGYKATLNNLEDMSVKASTDVLVDSYSWYIDGVLLQNNTDTLEIDGASIPTGEHTLAVLVQIDSAIASASIKFNVGFAEVIDFENMATLSPTFTLRTDADADGYESDDVGGPGEWKLSPIVSHGGSKAAQSGVIANNGYCYMDYEGTVPLGLKLSKVSFWYKISSEANYDYVKFWTWSDIDNDWDFIGRASGEIDWSFFSTSLEFPSGTEYSLSCSYEKDISVSAGQDAAWVDDIIFTYVNE